MNTHHIIYRSHGGTNSASNLITVGTKCHTYENHQEGNILWKWMMEKKKTKQYTEPPFMHALRKRVFKQYPFAKIVYGSFTTPKRKELGLEKSHYNDAISITDIDCIEKNTMDILKIKQVRKKKRSLHEATARKGRKEKNTASKRNNKNTPYVFNKKTKQFFHLHERIKFGNNIGWIAGFSGKTTAYVVDFDGEYISIPEKSYKQINLSVLEKCNNNNNWIYTRASAYAD